ncbi:hypothetical protein IAT38_004946 [Cryptococcus sp. DSM 104549]
MPHPIPLLALATTLLALLGTTSAQGCNATSLCPASSPCCSEYGFCGSGSYCLGGCDPRYSHTLTSCRPAPICESHETDFYYLERVQVNGSAYDGNATAYDWVVDAGTIVPSPDNTGSRLTLTQDNSGTKISSTRYIHYGTIDFVLEASKWAGVVTAAITMSDVKDEIDWEWVGAETGKVQTNYWFLGIANYSETEGASSDISSDASAKFHTYTFDWQEDYINWSIDGQVVRTVQKSETLSADGSQYKFPSTPSRIQISIWPAGISTSAQGTIDWAGGMIDWSDADYTSNGYFWNTIQSVKVSCKEDAGQTSGTTGWAYSGNDTTGVPVVTTTNASTLISSGSRTVGLAMGQWVWAAVAVVGGMGIAGGAALF